MTLLTSSCSTSWVESSKLDSSCETSWEQLDILDSDCETSWTQLNTLDSDCETSWTQLNALDSDCETSWEQLEILDKTCISPWIQNIPLDTSCILPWIQVTPLDSDCILPWVRVTPLDELCVIDMSGNIPDVDTKTLFCEFPWFAARSVIVVQQSVLFKRVSDSQEIKLMGCTIQTDIDSFNWTISGRVASKVDMGYIRPTAGPVETQLTVNGYTWNFLVENVNDNYTYQSGGNYSFNGTSPSVVLASPYDTPVTKIYTSPTQAQQIVNSELTGTGWAWDWNIIDWAIPADVFSVNNQTIMEIISTIAKAAGGFVNTKGGFPDGDPYEERLIFKYRYPTSPKNWGVTSPDHTILDGIISESLKWDPQPKYDHIYVSGKNAGVLVHVKRSGEPWTKAATTIIDQLNLTQQVAEQRGRNYLDKTGYDQTIYSIDLPLPDSAIGVPTVLKPGDLCAITDLDETWKGQVRGVRIDIQRPGVTQTVEIERHHT
jgi:hypothetical protein